MLQNAGGALQQSELTLHAPPCATHDGAVVDVVDDVVVVVGDGVVVVVGDGVVVVVGAAGQRPLTVSHGWPEQQTVAVEQKSPVRVQQPHDVGPFGWHRSNCTEQLPEQFVELHACMSGWQEQVLPLGAFIMHVCPDGHVPPQTPAAPLGTSWQGIVVVVVGPGVVVVVVVITVVDVNEDVLVAIVVDVLVVAATQRPLMVSHGWPEQQTLAVEQRSPVSVQQLHCAGPVGWHRSNCTEQAPEQFVELHPCMTGWHEHVLPLGAFMRHACPGGHVPPQTPAAPLAMSRHGMVVVVVWTVVVLVVVVVGAAVVVVVQVERPMAWRPLTNAARSAGLVYCSVVSTLRASCVARPAHVGAENTS